MDGDIRRGCVGRRVVGGDDMKIIQQSGYRMTWDDGGSYRVDSVDGTEMPLVTFDANLAIECFVNWAKKKTATAATVTVK